MTGTAFLVVVCAVLLASANAGGILNSCDDCRSSVQRMLGCAYFDGQSYNSYQVTSNGMICLLNAGSGQTCDYGYSPQSIVQARGAPFIASFWNDADLRCGSANYIQFEESRMNSNILRRVQAITGTGFNPDVYVLVQYRAIKEYPCSTSGPSNTFDVIIATETFNRKTDIILFYSDMNWIRVAPPTIGVGSGTGRGQIGPVVSSPQQLDGQDPLFLVTNRFVGQVLEQKIEEALESQSQFEEMADQKNKGSIAQFKGSIEQDKAPSIAQFKGSIEQDKAPSIAQSEVDRLAERVKSLEYALKERKN